MCPLPVCPSSVFSFILASPSLYVSANILSPSPLCPLKKILCFPCTLPVYPFALALTAMHLCFIVILVSVTGFFLSLWMISLNITVRGGCKFRFYFYISVRWLTRGMDHIFTDNKEDSIVSHSLSPVAPHSPMHNKSDPLCQHQSLHTDKRVIVCSVISTKDKRNLCTRSWILASLLLLQCIQVILRSPLKSFFAFPVLSHHILFILLKSVYPCPE